MLNQLQASCFIISNFIAPLMIWASNIVLHFIALLFYYIYLVPIFLVHILPQCFPLLKELRKTILIYVCFNGEFCLIFIFYCLIFFFFTFQQQTLVFPPKHLQDSTFVHSALFIYRHRLYLYNQPQYGQSHDSGFNVLHLH